MAIYQLAPLQAGVSISLMESWNFFVGGMLNPFNNAALCCHTFDKQFLIIITRNEEINEEWLTFIVEVSFSRYRVSMHDLMMNVNTCYI